MTRWTKKSVIILFIIILGGTGLIAQKNHNFGSNAPQIFPLSSSASHDGPLAFLNPEIFIFVRTNQDYTKSEVFKSYFSNNAWQEEKADFSASGYDSSYAPFMAGTLFMSNRIPKKEDLSKEWNIWVAHGPEGDLTFEPLPYPINSNKFECCVIKGVENTFYFSSNRDGSWDIYKSTWDGTIFTTPIKLDHPNTSDNGEWPSYVAPNGRFMLFSSIRKSGFGGDDIYISKFDGTTWSEAEILPEPINSASYEDRAILSHDGQVLYWSSRRKTGFSENMGNIYFIEINSPVLKNMIVNDLIN